MAEEVCAGERCIHVYSTAPHTRLFLDTPNLKKAQTPPGMKMLLFVEDCGISF